MGRFFCIQLDIVIGVMSRVFNDKTDKPWVLWIDGKNLMKEGY